MHWPTNLDLDERNMLCIVGLLAQSCVLTKDTVKLSVYCGLRSLEAC